MDDQLVYSKNRNIFIFFIYVSIFVNSWVLFQEPFEFYIGYVLFVVTLPFFMPKYGIPRYLAAIFGILLAVGISNIFLGNNTFALFFKIFTGLFLSYLFYYYILREWKFNLEYLFKLYLKGAYIVAVIGVVQLVSYIIGFKWGYDYSWLLNKWGVVRGGMYGIRINAVFGEPSQMADTLSAAAFVAIYDFIKGNNGFYYSRIKSAIVLISYLSTFSSLGYFALVLSVFILFSQFGFVRYAILSITLSILLFTVLYDNVPEFRDRVDSQVHVFTTGEFAVGAQNGSSIIQYNNFHIATENFKHNFLFGTGLGSHPIAFDKYSITKHIKIVGFDLNKSDANSMLFRLISETGLFGVGLFLFVTIRCFVSRRKEEIYTKGETFRWLISSAIFVMITVKLIRQGHYFINGFPFFFLMYYYNFKDYLFLKRSYQSIEI